MCFPLRLLLVLQHQHQPLLVEVLVQVTVTVTVRVIQVIEKEASKEVFQVCTFARLRPLECQTFPVEVV